MKSIKPITLITILIPTVLFIIKLSADIEMCNWVNTLDLETGDMQPSLVTGGIKTMVLSSAMVLLSLISSIIRFKREKEYAKPILILNVLVFIYALIPVGVIYLMMKLNG